MTKPKRKKLKVSKITMSHIVIKPRDNKKDCTKDIDSFMDVMTDTIQKTWPSLQVVGIGGVSVEIPSPKKDKRKK